MIPILSPTDEKFYGFGEKYNQIEQRGKTEL